MTLITFVIQLMLGIFNTSNLGIEFKTNFLQIKQHQKNEKIISSLHVFPLC